MYYRRKKISTIFNIIGDIVLEISLFFQKKIFKSLKFFRNIFP